MAAHEPPHRTIDVTGVYGPLPDALTAVSRKRERIIVEQDGVAMAALVSLDDLQRPARLDAEREDDFKAFERIAAAFAHETPDESERLAALALAQVRDEIQVDYLVTMDRQLLRLGVYEGVRIVGTREFLAILEREAGE